MAAVPIPRLRSFEDSAPAAQGPGRGRRSDPGAISRGLSESLNDISSIKNLLDNLVRESETLLLQQSRVNTDLQEGLMRTRMVRFGGMSTRLRRIVRQTARLL